MAALASSITSATLSILHNFQIVIAQLLNFVGYIPFAILQVFSFIPFAILQYFSLMGYIFGWIGFFLAWLLGASIPQLLGGLSAVAGGEILGYSDTNGEIYVPAAASTLAFQVSFLFYLKSADLDPAKTFSMTALTAMSVVGVLVMLACGWVVFFACMQIQKLERSCARTVTARRRSRWDTSVWRRADMIKSNRLATKSGSRSRGCVWK